MERVRKGEKYWVVYLIGDKCKTCMMIAGQNSPATPIYDSDCFQFDNYFSSEASAEAIAEKIRKVLKGADVIEMPKYVEEFNTSEEIYIQKGYSEGEYCHKQSFCWGFQEGVDWLKSKVK